VCRRKKAKRKDICLQTFFLLFKGAMSRWFSRFLAENVLEFKLNTFSRTRNALRSPPLPFKKKNQKRNQMIFSKEVQTIVNCGYFSHETKEKLENISLMFSICNLFPSCRSAARQLIIILERWLRNFKGNWASSYGFPLFAMYLSFLFKVVILKIVDSAPLTVPTI